MAGGLSYDPGRWMPCGAVRFKAEGEPLIRAGLKV